MMDAKTILVDPWAQHYRREGTLAVVCDFFGFPEEPKPVWSCMNCAALVVEDARNAHSLFHYDTKTELPKKKNRRKGREGTDG